MVDVLFLFWNITTKGTPNGPNTQMNSSQMTRDILRKKTKESVLKFKFGAAVKLLLEHVQDVDNTKSTRSHPNMSGELLELRDGVMFLMLPAALLGRCQAATGDQKAPPGIIA